MGISFYLGKEELRDMKTKRPITTYIRRKLILGTLPVLAILFIGLAWMECREVRMDGPVPLEKIPSSSLVMISLFWLALIFTLVYLLQKRAAGNKWRR